MYLEGLNRFLDFAFANSSLDISHQKKILCPCKNCSNNLWKTQEDVYDHLVCDGFLKGYTNWIFHGESTSSVSFAHASHAQDESDQLDDIHEMLQDAFPMLNPDNMMGDSTNEDAQEPNAEAKKFYRLVEEGNKELYPGCKNFSNLAFIVQLLHIKCKNGWSNKSFNMLLQLLKKALPDGETLPRTYYEAKKIIGDLGLGYNKIHACPNDCMLYWKEFKNASSCATCGASRWRVAEKNLDDDMETSSKSESKIPAKVLCYFPLKPRLQRIFMSSKIASLMTWHKEGSSHDGRLRHPVDSPAWKTFDHLHPSFSSEPRNVRLGLASDGFSPFRTMNIPHSTWPVVLIPYNLPPWLCMKQPYFLLSLLIDGPSAPGNDIDVYLQPLIEELKELWEIGVETYDASRKENFQMHAAVLWTISDFPGYAVLSGWSTKGQYACPSCHIDTYSHYLKFGWKYCYMGHRRFLESDHKFRYENDSFNNHIELDDAPTSLTGADILKQLEGYNVAFGKKLQGTSRKRKRDEDAKKPKGWKKKSIFFSLPYWKDLILRHNLDVMHIEKNVCESIINTLLNVEGKTKDNVKSRLDLEALNIRHALHLKQIEGGKRAYLPPACFSMTPREKDIFLKVLKSIKVPDGYSSNISRRVNLKERKIIGLKSHDNHILMQQLLPLAIRKALPKNVSSVIIEFCTFFREICSKVVKVTDMQQLERRIALVLCNMERIFPPSFFDIMIHLPIHLANEVRLAGPVQYRWMYPIERYAFLKFNLHLY